MAENYLLGDWYVQINALLSATAWNLKKWMKKAISWLCEKWIEMIYRIERISKKGQDDGIVILKVYC